MGSVLCRPSSARSEPSLPAPGDEPVCPGFDYPPVMRSPGWPPRPGPGASLQLRLVELKPLAPSVSPATACECPFPGGAPGEPCACLHEMEEQQRRRSETPLLASGGHRYRHMTGCILRWLRTCEHCGKFIVGFYHAWIMCTGRSESQSAHWGW